MGPGSTNVKTQATYWEPAGPGDDGNLSFSAPALIYCFWTESTEIVKNLAGEEIVVKNIVHVSQKVSENGFLALGNQTAQANPYALEGVAFEIQAYQESPDLRNMSQNRRAYL